MPNRIIEVVPFTEAAFFDAMKSNHITRAQVESHRRARYLSSYLSAIGARTLVIEELYTDADYLDDYASYYAKSFVDYSRRCKRLHFFSSDFDRERCVRILAEPAGVPRDFPNAYLGFVVARPLPSAIVGRTVLKTYDTDGGRRNYLAVKSYEAHLMGTSLSIKSLAFQEQDTVLAACATVSLWSAFQKTSELFGTRQPTPVEITRAATSTVFESRPLPSRFLTLGQMTRAVREVGLEPEVIQCGPNVPFISLIYGYLQLGLPVILGLEIEGSGGHAVTVTGYSLRPTQSIPHEHEVTNAPPLIGLRIDELYVHDDGVGPFARIAVKSRRSDDDFPTSVYFEGDWVDALTGRPRRLFPVWAIVPVYHKIRLTFLDLQDWIAQMNWACRQVTTDFSHAEWAISLANVNEFKDQIRSSVLPSATRERVLFSDFPRFVWRACLSLGGTPTVELVFDATGMTRSLPILDVLYYDAAFQSAIASLFALPAITTVLDESLVEFMRHTPP